MCADQAFCFELPIPISKFHLIILPDMQFFFHPNQRDIDSSIPKNSYIRNIVCIDNDISWNRLKNDDFFIFNPFAKIGKRDGGTADFLSVWKEDSIFLKWIDFNIKYFFQIKGLPNSHTMRWGKSELGRAGNQVLWRKNFYDGSHKLIFNQSLWNETG